ncbi:MAG: hypothetical protein A2831_03425 [Candidatus Yanofskybacteria bacterium RIFCSPHIGHO2_01_FULL_44_17]|uniref:Uncharacterized protein n=1 Tax=Candidatus Yanofskybacteria bacterium RIFCSPHIGHO2_01_FULL_44_17 TaxID=1802668 RepID=A0A1F8EZV5_9BACT|nr:MAG: hypothetical protein A2831_03425 [Candidatus Yanofskybacteria bacterium RIFCSPHIGHO2_01_FULL_44_17]
MFGLAMFLLCLSNLLYLEAIYVGLNNLPKSSNLPFFIAVMVGIFSEIGLRIATRAACKNFIKDKPNDKG